MLRLFILLPMVISLTAAATASTKPKPTRFSSAYTKLDLAKCTRIDTVPEHQSARWRCTGYKGIPLFVQSGDERYDVDAGREDSDEFWGTAFDYPGSTIEWRLTGGSPFAIIYRLISEGEDVPRKSFLVVVTIGRTAPGCRVA